MSKKQPQQGPRLRQHQSFRRRWLTWMRMARYGANNFTRNMWLTTAATVVMALTLLVMFTTFIARSVLVETVEALRAKVEIPIYLKDDISEQEVTYLQKKLREIPNVSKVEYVSKEAARQKSVQEGSRDVELLEAIAELEGNPFPASVRVALKDPDQLEELKNLVTKDKSITKLLNPEKRRKPVFETERGKSIQEIGRWATLAERSGLILSTVFIVLSSLIVFNTIRMAIFNRREEITMMKLIGADRNFIRGPFVVEAVMYGFFAAIIATGLGYVGLFAVKDKLAQAGLPINNIEMMLIDYLPVVIIVMILLGAIIGVISSTLAVRRYLKV